MKAPPAPLVAITLLGGCSIRVRGGGPPIRLPTKKAQALLA